MEDRFVERWRTDIVEAGSRAVRAALGASRLPDILYHFTECEGLVSILQTRTLRASLATGLSDDSEVRHGVGRARHLLAERPASVSHAFRERVDYFLDPTNTFAGNPIAFHAYVISFCSRTDRSVHWLHYGRQGTGFALGFDVKTLSCCPPFELVRVVYDEAEQDRILSCIVESAWKAVADSGLDPDAGGSGQTTFDAAAHAVAAHLRMAAAALKNRAFADEEEWRLITYDVRAGEIELPNSGAVLAKHFRVMAGRVIPHVELAFDVVPLTEVVLGSHVPMEVDDPALAILIRESGIGRAIKVSRSPVPLRPA